MTLNKLRFLSSLTTQKEKLMKTILVLICSLALACLAYSAQQEENKPKKPEAKKKQTQTVQHAAAPGGGAQKEKGSQKVATPGGHRKAVSFPSQPFTVPQKSAGGRPAEVGKPAGKGKATFTDASGQHATETGKHTGGVNKPSQQQKAGYVEAGKHPGNVNKPGAGKPTAAGRPLKPQKFNLSKQPNTAKAPPVKFQPNKHIEGSQNWQGEKYTVFRNYKSEWHDQNWWHSHHNNIVFVFGAPYYWNAGYWFPAWGYAPNAYYAWDGPIYAYNHLPPDQVIANVQASLQQQGYYHGEVDGLIGPLTRGAIADYQRDHGLYVTSAIDQPTLQSLFSPDTGQRG
jgi:hypothetical protein